MVRNMPWNRNSNNLQMYKLLQRGFKGLLTVFLLAYWEVSKAENSITLIRHLFWKSYVKLSNWGSVVVDFDFFY